jgi:hypothetical protein
MNDGTSSSSAIITSSVPMAILTTCHLIKGKAESIVRATAESPLGLDSLCLNGVHAGAPRIEAELTALVPLSGNGNLIPAIIAWHQQIQETQIELFKIQDAFIIGYMCTFLAIQQYAPNQGTLEQAAIRLLDFVRRAGWAIARQKRMAVGTENPPATTPPLYPSLPLRSPLRSR